MIDSTRRAFVVTAVLTAVFTMSVFYAGGFDEPHVARDLILLALNTLPLLGVRRHPVAVVLVFSVAYPLWLMAGHEAHLFQSLPTLAALYAAGSWPRELWVRAIALVGPTWMMAAAAVGIWPGADLAEIGYIAVMFVLAWGLGVVIAGRRAYAQQLEVKTAQLAAAQEELADRAVADERVRIARELHDVVAHAMSVITVRAGVGAHLCESRPAEAAQALGVIERTGREALAELRRMLAVLRDPDARGPRPEPQPGLADVPQLIERAEAAGISVVCTTEATARPLPPGLDLAAYRVIQEALTNVVKHAPGSRVSVTVRYGLTEVDIDVRNPARSVEQATPGQGLRGMAERVALYDGRLDAGLDGEEFRVHARFPLETADVPGGSAE